MTEMNKQGAQQLLLGGSMFLFGGTVLFLIIGMLCLIITAVKNERQVVHYPGSEPITSHTIYSGLPFGLRWDDVYRTTDDFATVYNYYSTRFEMGAEVHALARCNHLESSDQWLGFRQQISVTLCDMPAARMIFVTRSNSWR